MNDYVYEEDRQDSRGWISDPFFESPIEVPLGDVTGVPRKCVEIADDWVPVILTALERLKYADCWDGTAEEIARAHQNIETLQVNLMEGLCEGGGETGYECATLPLYAPNIFFYPNDPYSDDDPVPLGYSCHPWYETGVNLISGAKPGDIVIEPLCGLIGFPPVIPLSGVPRVQIRVEGPADVDIEFVDVFQGGIAVIFVDGFPSSYHDCQLYSLTDILNVEQWSDLFLIGLEVLTQPTAQDQISITTPGSHVIEIQFFPRVSLDTNIGWGGGIRSVQICSAEEQIDLSQFVTDVRIQDGNLEKQIDMDWVTVGPIDQDDIQEADDLRANGCQLQAFDLASQEWVDVPDAKFYRTDVDCPILHTVNIVPGSDGYHLQLDSGSDLNAAMVGAFGANAFFRGIESSILNNSYGAAMAVNGSDFAYVKDAGGGAPNFGMFNVVASGGKLPLSVMSQHASPVGLQRWYDHQSRIMAEISKEGWFSAIQQLVVNDFSATGTKRAQGRMLGQWLESTDAIRKGRLILQADDYNGTREGLRLEADGDEPRLGFFGVTAVDRPILTGADWPTVLTELLVNFDELGLIDNQTAYNFGNPFQESVAVETYYESYWDITDFFPVSNDIGLIDGTWVNGSGFREGTIGAGEGVSISRQIDEYSAVLAYKLQIQVANLSGGVVTLTAAFLVADPDVLIHVQSFGEGIYQVTIPIEKSSEGERVDIYVVTDDGETADVAIEAFWERGIGLPPFDRHHVTSETKIFTEIPTTWQTPSA